MDPHSFIARAEAQRWLGIAEKLLMGHDLVGSKTFAIRARESDPRLEAADQILAIADTLLAAEKRVVGNNGAQQPDFYAILQLVRFVQDTDHIASQYRRLAMMLNPHQNRFPYSDQAFQLVNDAWAVLSNPMRKSMYDSELDFPPQQQMNSLGFNLEQQHHQQHQQHHHQQQQQHNFFSINHMGTGHEQELPEPQQTFQTRLQQSHQQQQLQQHNFLSQPNPARPLPVREQEQLFHHREQEQLFQPQVQPFQVTSASQQQTRLSPQPPQPQPPIHSPPPPAAQPPFSWPQAPPQQQTRPQPQPQPPQSPSPPAAPQPPFSWPQAPPLSQQQQQSPRSQQQTQSQSQSQQLHFKPQQHQRQHQQEFLKTQPQPQQQQHHMKPEPQLYQQQGHLKPQPHQQQEHLQPQPQPHQQQEQLQPQPQLHQPHQPQSQLQQQQELQQKQLHEEQQQQQQHQESLSQNATPVQPPSQVNINNGLVEEETEPEAETETADENVDDSPTFWTSCPYCFYMYEYPRVYVDCTLRCDNCKRAFQAIRISSPPPIIEGQEASFYCWGYFPIGVSISHLQKNTRTTSNWTPFSPLYDASSNIQNHLNDRAAPKKNTFVNKSSGPRIYIDDFTDDVFIGISDPSDDSDDEWYTTERNKSKRTKKDLETGFKERKQVLALRAIEATNGTVNNLKHGVPMQKGVEVPAVPVAETSKKPVGSNPRNQSGRVVKELGKLDLNVEFNNNEGEEPAPRMTAGNKGHGHGHGHGHGQGEEDTIEEGMFFEGLDEFLSSLPILSVVNEEKVKAA